MQSGVQRRLLGLRASCQAIYLDCPAHPAHIVGVQAFRGLGVDLSQHGVQLLPAVRRFADALQFRAQGFVPLGGKAQGPGHGVDIQSRAAAEDGQASAPANLLDRRQRAFPIRGGAEPLFPGLRA